ncbi:hypothetical protein DO97_07945 [Neosynechococcus sphagnicola sy1]|uniref:Uncharacterized protein n=1 Tax=Neosynechococcus sphagnicola sy1 TaxID=1497020 RepID=A0A098TNS4_9CYAN|nr:hypothetical protein DO97_07945 [Neosynechococcus sphagnicola sy1]
MTCSLNADSGLYEATISNQVVQALATKNGNQAYTIEQQFERLAEIEKEQCEAKNQESVAYAAIPEQWDIKVGNNRPQLIIQFGEKLQGNKVDSPKYSIVIPWANTTTAIKNSPIGQWDKGKIRCSYEMPDNSKIIVFAKTENEGKRVINQALTVVQGNKKRSDNLIICTRIDSTRFKEITVVPRILRFFSTGQGKAIPDWEVTL